MHCHRPLKFAPCADAPDAAKVVDSTIAVNKAFMIFLLHNPAGLHLPAAQSSFNEKLNLRATL
jgi:hypothetical protein